ncbi:Hpt domain-containing protein [Delftia tsuruhatensis]
MAAPLAAGGLLRRGLQCRRAGRCCAAAGAVEGVARAAQAGVGGATGGLRGVGAPAACAASPPRQEAGTGEGADAQPDVRPDVRPDVQPEAPSDALAIANFFGGDAGLFHSYRDICLAHLPDDIARMEVLIAEQNAMALRRQAHSLQSVLRLLGQERASGLTRSLEQACLAGDWAGVTDVWRPLGEALQQLLESAGQRDPRD